MNIAEYIPSWDTVPNNLPIVGSFSAEVSFETFSLNFDRNLIQRLWYIPLTRKRHAVAGFLCMVSTYLLPCVLDVRIQPSEDVFYLVWQAPKSVAYHDLRLLSCNQDGLELGENIGVKIHALAGPTCSTKHSGTRILRNQTARYGLVAAREPRKDRQDGDIPVLDPHKSFSMSRKNYLTTRIWIWDLELFDELLSKSRY